jgi:branched-chain amino acid transport system substrate-binding protein
MDVPRRRCWAGILMVGGLLLTACGGAAGGGTAAGPIKVGYSMTQTGPNAPPAEYEMHGYQLAVDQINAAGGLLGRKLQLVGYDDQGSTSTAVQLYQKLITSDRVDLLLGPYEADLTAAIAPLVNSHRLAMPSLAANIDYYQGQYPYLVQSITQTPHYMIPVIDLAATKGYKTIALLVQDTAFPQELARGIRQEAATRGLRVVFDQAYPADTTNFGPLVLTAAQKSPDIIIGATYLADAIGIVKAAKAQNVNARMFAFSIGPVEPQFAAGLGSAADGVLGTTLWFPTLHTSGNTPFISAYRRMFGQDPDYHTAMAYAMVKVFAQAIRQAGSLDQAKIRDAMKGLSVDTVAGHFKVNKTGLQVGYSSYVLQWQNGRQVLVYPADVANAPPQLPHPPWS